MRPKTLTFKDRTSMSEKLQIMWWLRRVHGLQLRDGVVLRNGLTKWTLEPRP